MVDLEHGLYLHVGTPKSATSTIQAMLEANRERLHRAGLSQPHADRYAAFRGFLDGAALADREAWQSLQADIREASAAIVFSQERLATLETEAVASFVAALGAPVAKVIITARDLGRVVPSQWQTNVKNGGRATWAEFQAAVCGDEEGASPTTVQQRRDIARRFWLKQDLPDIVRRWRHALSTTPISIVTVPDDSSPDGVVIQRFLAAIDGALAVDRDESDRGRQNPSLGAVSIELLRRINVQVGGQTPKEVRKAAVKDVLVNLMARGTSNEPAVAVSPRYRGAIEERSAAMIADLERLDLEIHGGYDDLVPRWTPKSTAEVEDVGPDDLPPERLLAEALGHLAELAAERARQVPSSTTDH